MWAFLGDTSTCACSCASRERQASVEEAAEEKCEVVGVGIVAGLIWGLQGGKVEILLRCKWPVQSGYHNGRLADAAHIYVVHIDVGIIYSSCRGEGAFKETRQASHLGD